MKVILEEIFYIDKKTGLEKSYYVSYREGDPDKKQLMGTHKVMSAFEVPKSLISPIAKWWAVGILNKALEFDSTNEERINEITTAKTAIELTTDFFDKELRKTFGIGNYAEELVCKLIEGKTKEDIVETDKVQWTQRGEEFGILLFEGFKHLEESIGEELEVVGFQIALAGKDDTSGIIDALFRTKKTKELVLIDFKTGKFIEKEKLKSLKMQLLGSYYEKVFLEYKKYPKYVLGICAYEKKIVSEDFVSELTTGFQLVDLMKKEEWIVASQEKFNDALEIFKIRKKWGMEKEEKYIEDTE